MVLCSGIDELLTPVLGMELHVDAARRALHNPHQPVDILKSSHSTLGFSLPVEGTYKEPARFERRIAGFSLIVRRMKTLQM
jgi:hypothetical protein